MYNFKEFFNKNYNIILEAYRGSYSKTPVVYDEEDLDFLYQIDQKNWVEAVRKRYMRTWQLLKKRQEIRNEITKKMINSVKNSRFLQKIENKRIFDISEDNIKEFKNFLLELGLNYDSYGNKAEVVDPEEIRQRKYWINKFFKKYDIENVSTRGTEDNKRVIKDLIYEIIKRIVIYVKGGDDETYVVGNKNIKFYINRLIQKIETTKNEEHHLKTRLENLSRVLGKEVRFESSGRYGFDLSSPKIKRKDGKKLYSFASGYNFPKDSSIEKSLERLLILNYQRHLPNEKGIGDLPTDDPNHPYQIKYKIIRTSGEGSRIKRHSDEFAFDVYQKNFSNNISRFITNNPNLDWSSTNIDEIFQGSVNPEKEKEEMISGVWFVKYMLNNEKASLEDSVKINDSEIKKIFHGKTSVGESLYEREVEAYKENGKIGKEAINNITSYKNVNKIRKLKDIFSEYFGKLRASDIIRSQTIYGPKILSIINTGDPEKDAEIRKKELSLLDEKDKEELKQILGPENWEKFIKTGRLPYKIDEKTKKILVGDSSPPIILPHITIGSGADRVSFPLINPGSYMMQMGLIDPKKEKEIIQKKEKLRSQIDNYESLRDLNLDSIEDLEKIKLELEANPEIDVNINIVNLLIKRINSKKILDRAKTTTLRSSAIISPKGEETPVAQYYRTKHYRHGKRGSILPGQRPESAGVMPSTPSEITARIGYYKIFPKGSVVISKSRGVLIDDKIWSSIDKIFEKNPKIKPEEIKPMKLESYNIVSSSFSVRENNVDVSNFLIIKEEEDRPRRPPLEAEFLKAITGSGMSYRTPSSTRAEDRSLEGGKKSYKGTERYNTSSKSWFDFKKAKEGESGDVIGWNDIIKGIKKALLEGNYGGHEADPYVRRYLLEPTNLQDLHDEIVYKFYHNSRKSSLYTPGGRIEEASSYVGTILQSKFKGAEARKKRTGEISGGEDVDLPSGSSEISIEDIQPLSEENDKDTLINILLDFNNSKKFELLDSRMTPLTVKIKDAIRPFLFRGYHDDFDDKENSIENAIENSSKVLSFDLNNINSKNYNIIKQHTETEKNILLSYWEKIFSVLYKKEESRSSLYRDFEELKKYFLESNKKTKDKINQIYVKRLLTLEKYNKTLSTRANIEKSNNSNSNEEIQIGINEIREIIKDINQSIKDYDAKISSNAIPTKKPGESDENFQKRKLSWKPDFKHSELKITDDPKLPQIINWYNMITSFLVRLSHKIDLQDSQPSVITFIATQRGGLSTFRPNELKFSVNVFFNKLSDNIKKFVKTFSENSPEDLGINKEQEDNIKKMLPVLGTKLEHFKNQLVKILSKK